MYESRTGESANTEASSKKLRDFLVDATKVEIRRNRIVGKDERFVSWTVKRLVLDKAIEIVDTSTEYGSFFEHMRRRLINDDNKDLLSPVLDRAVHQLDGNIPEERTDQDKIEVAQILVELDKNFPSSRSPKILETVAWAIFDEAKMMAASWWEEYKSHEPKVAVSSKSPQAAEGAVVKQKEHVLKSGPFDGLEIELAFDLQGFVFPLDHPSSVHMNARFCPKVERDFAGKSYLDQQTVQFDNGVRFGVFCPAPVGEPQLTPSLTYYDSMRPPDEYKVIFDKKDSNSKDVEPETLWAFEITRKIYKGANRQGGEYYLAIAKSLGRVERKWFAKLIDREKQAFRWKIESSQGRLQGRAEIVETRTFGDNSYEVKLGHNEVELISCNYSLSSSAELIAHFMGFPDFNVGLVSEIHTSTLKALQNLPDNVRKEALARRLALLKELHPKQFTIHLGSARSVIPDMQYSLNDQWEQGNNMGGWYC